MPGWLLIVSWSIERVEKALALFLYNSLPTASLLRPSPPCIFAAHIPPSVLSAGRGVHYCIARRLLPLLLLVVAAAAAAAAGTSRHRR